MTDHKAVAALAEAISPGRIGSPEQVLANLTQAGWAVVRVCAVTAQRTELERRGTLLDNAASHVETVNNLASSWGEQGHQQMLRAEAAEARLKMVKAALEEARVFAAKVRMGHTVNQVMAQRLLFAITEALTSIGEKS